MTNFQEYNPYKNDKVISIVKQEDGNYKGFMTKFGEVIEVRGVSPQEVLDLLIIHQGEK